MELCILFLVLQRCCQVTLLLWESEKGECREGCTIESAWSPLQNSCLGKPGLVTLWVFASSLIEFLLKPEGLLLSPIKWTGTAQNGLGFLKSHHGRPIIHLFNSMLADFSFGPSLHLEEFGNNEPSQNLTNRPSLQAPKWLFHSIMSCRI